MEKRNMTERIFVICSVFFVIGMFATLALAEVIVHNISIEPYIISLNANIDSNATREVIVRMGCYLSGQRITESYAEFIIGGDVVTISTDMRVTRLGICQVYFDRAEIQEYALDNGLDGVTAVTVSGSYTFEPISGGVSFGPIEFIGEGFVFFR